MTLWNANSDRTKEHQGNTRTNSLHIHKVYRQDYIWLSLSRGPEHRNDKSRLTSAQARHPLLLGTTTHLQGVQRTRALARSLLVDGCWTSMHDAWSLLDASASTFYRSDTTLFIGHVGDSLRAAATPAHRRLRALQSVSSTLLSRRLVCYSCAHRLGTQRVNAWSRTLSACIDAPLVLMLA